MTPTSFDRSRLSARENEILNLAIEGLTDQQIAQKIDISTSTVNSYWVRIRGKLGHLSRTEMVANSLRAQASAREQEYLEQTRQLNLLNAKQVMQEETNAESYRAALEAMPEAMLVVDGVGKIIFANSRMEWMFGYREGELNDSHVSLLALSKDRPAMKEKIDRYLEKPHPLRMGIDKVVYGQRKDGTIVRIILLLDSSPTSTGTVTSCIVRSFLEEVDTLRRHTVSYGRTL